MSIEVKQQYDVVIIGAGPAGMTTAITLSEYGLAVAVFDEQPRPGGQIYRNVELANDLLDGVLAGDSLSRKTVQHGSRLVERFLAADISYFPESLVWNLESPAVIAVKRYGKVYQTAGRYVVIATGAQERPVPFTGWQLPGVMGVGAAQIMLKSAGALPDSAPVLFGSGPLLYLYAAQLLGASLAPAAILDTTTPRASIESIKYLPRAFRSGKSLIDGVRLLRTLSASSVPHYKNVSSLNAVGSSKLKRVEFTVNRKIESIETDLLLSHHGVIPELQLLRAAGGNCSWNESGQSWQPTLDEWGASSVAGIYVCGDGAGIYGAYGAEFAAEVTSYEILYRVGKVSLPMRDKLSAEPLKLSECDRSIRPFLEAKYRVADSLLNPSGETIVCRCESVTADQIIEAVAQGCLGPNQVKSYTRCGMGACQGRMCGPAVEAIVASRTGRSRAEVGHFRARPPVRPVSIGAIASLDQRQKPSIN